MVHTKNNLLLENSEQYTWMAELRYRIQFKWVGSSSIELGSQWLYQNVGQLPFSGKHKQLEAWKLVYAVELYDDLVLLLLSYSENIMFVYDMLEDKIIFNGESSLHS